MAYQGAGDSLLRTDLRTVLQSWNRADLDRLPQAQRLAALAGPAIAPGDHGSQSAACPSPADALKALIRAALGQFGDQASLARLLERYYLREENRYQIQRDEHVSERTFYYRLGKAIAALAGAIWALARTANAERTFACRADPTRNLPSPLYTQLFGVERALNEVLARLEDPTNHWLVSLEGMGGLGKTALAHRAASLLAQGNRFAGVAWITAQQEVLTWSGVERVQRPALNLEQLLDAVAGQLQAGGSETFSIQAKISRLRSLFGTRPYLIVVDNLETATDCATLPIQLWDLARPCKFLITSRCRVGACPGLSALPLDELAEPDSLALVRHEAQVRGVRELLDTPDETLQPILAVTGGNPLALKLVAGQLASLPLDRVLAGLRAAPSGSHIYEFLYRRSWELLSAPARHLLLHMTFLPMSGGDWEDLAAITALDEKNLASAITELVDHSLLQADTLQTRRYTIHRLTHHFVTGQLAGGPAFAAGAVRTGRHFLARARQLGEDWPALMGRRDQLLQAMEVCAGLGKEGAQIVVEGACLLNDAMIRQGLWETWEPYLRLAQEAAARVGDERAEAGLWSQLGALKTAQRDLEAASELHRRAAETFRHLGDRLNEARALRWLGNVHYSRPDRPAALECYEQARHLLASLRAASPADNAPVELSHVHNNLANVHLVNGDWPRALFHYEQAAALLDADKHGHYLATILNNVGFLHWEMGHWQQAVEVLSRALPLSLAAGDKMSQANTHHYLCRVRADLGALDQALTSGRQALALRKDLGSTEGLADIYTDLAAVYLVAGEAARAIECLALAEPLWQQAGRPDGLARLVLLQADVSRRAGEWGAAVAACQEAVALLEEGDDLPRRLLALLELSAARHRAGDEPAARAMLPRIEALARDLGRPDMDIRLCWLHAELEPGRAPQILEQALERCRQGDAGDDRIRRLGQETAARLNQ